MNVKRSILSFLIGIGLISCGNDSETPEYPEGIETYINVTVDLPGTRSGTRDLPEDYNPDGTYEGKDAVSTLDIYMQSADGTIEAKRFTVTDLSSDGETVTPNQPFRTTSGYKTVYVVLNNPNPLGTTITTEHELIDVTLLAGYTTIDSVEYDKIAMTGKSGQIYIEPDISTQQVVDGSANHIAVSVNRVASRVIVTTTASMTLTADNTVLGTLSDLTYSVAQGTNKIYWIEQENYVSYGYDYVPTLGTYVGQADTYYDYSDLDNPSAIPTQPVASDGYKSLKGKYVFENTHAEGTLATTRYRKGNTAYVLVRVTLTPTAAAIADGGSLTNGTFYVGQSDGLIYSSKAAAQSAVSNQKVAVYQEGTMLYYAWLNPDDILNPLNSPVVRNNIYHINITGFTRIGYNWNPLYPEDPDTTTPQNPDPKPGNPDEPDIDINPEDPLTPEQTYMTVDVTVLNWTVHSYDIEY